MEGRRGLVTRLESGYGVLKGKEKKMYSIVNNAIGEKWFKHYMAKGRRGIDYALFNGRGELQGYAVMGENLETPIGKSTYLYLIGAKQRKGYGTRILRQVIEEARMRHIKYIFLEPTNDKVRAWYRTFGFQDHTPELMFLNLSSNSR